MLAPLRDPKMERRKIASAITVPAPLEGWVSMNDPRADNLTTARILDNLVPGRVYMESRKGYAVLSNLGTNLSVETLMSYERGASRTLLAASGGKLFSVPETPAAAPTPFRYSPQPAIELGSGYGSDRWQYVSMANAADELRLVMVNGVDGIKVYDHIQGIKDVTPTPEIDDLIDVTTFKSRLWFVQSGTSTLYYGDSLANKPSTLTPFYVGPFLKQGGDCVAIESLSLDGGSGPDDYLVVITSRGEILIFAGIDPATDFALVGVFNTAEPLGHRCLRKIGNDLMYYGSRGPEALGKLYAGLGRADVIGQAIQPHFEEAIRNNFYSFGWSLLLDTENSWVICNVPTLPPAKSVQFVLNLENNAWFRITGWNAVCMEQHHNRVYFGNSRGRVFIASYGLNDNENPIPVDYMCSWNNFGVPNIKKFNQCKMTINSVTRPNPRVDMMADYEERDPRSAVGFANKAVVSPWNVSPWNTSPWSSAPAFYSNTFGLNNHGYVGAMRFRENVEESTMRIYGYQILFEVGEAI